jgi:hypothetical protein
MLATVREIGIGGGSRAASNRFGALELSGSGLVIGGWSRFFVTYRLNKVPTWLSLREKHRLQSATCVAAMTR